jgi:hypothetical protein
MEFGLFKNAANLRYVDMLMCDSTNVISDIKKNGLSRLGIDTQKTLVYVPDTYGDNSGTTNIVVADGNALKADRYRLVADKDYCVPYAFTAKTATLTRTLTKDAAATLCLPYGLKSVPRGVKAYVLSDRDGNTAVFREVSELTGLVPHVVVSSVNGVQLTGSESTGISVPMSTGTVGGQQSAPGFLLRGSLSSLGNEEASEIDAYVMDIRGNWSPVSATAATPQVQPFTAYMLIPRGSGNYPSRLEDGPDIPTDIDTLKTIDADGTERYYDLNGRELPEKPAQGVYIHNGKKYVSK